MAAVEMGARSTPFHQRGEKPWEGRFVIRSRSYVARLESMAVEQGGYLDRGSGNTQTSA